jgi:hypothetical protein
MPDAEGEASTVVLLAIPADTNASSIARAFDSVLGPNMTTSEIIVVAAARTSSQSSLRLSNGGSPAPMAATSWHELRSLSVSLNPEQYLCFFYANTQPGRLVHRWTIRPSGEFRRGFLWSCC